jgi:Flp pilus assembly pilin Flp
MQSLVRLFRSDTRAVTALEYALIASFIFLVIIVSVTNVGRNLSPIFNQVSSEL